MGGYDRNGGRGGGNDRGGRGGRGIDRNNDRAGRFDQNRNTGDRPQEKKEIKPNSAAAAALAIAGMSNKANEAEINQVANQMMSMPPPPAAQPYQQTMATPAQYPPSTASNNQPKPSTYSAFVQGKTTIPT